jgi:hypothetical protein
MSIPFAFFILSSLLLWLVIGAKGHWLIKASVISFVLYFCVSIDFSLENLLGWPSSQSLPEKFQVHWIKIREPNKKTKEQGAIYVWVTNLNQTDKEEGWDGWRRLFVSFNNYDLREPRAYRLFYSKEDHQKAQRAITLLKGGDKVGGGNGKGKGKGKGGKGKGDGDGGKKNGGGSLSRNGGVYFEKLPPPRLPDKG